MPTYEYACAACGHEWEQLQRITEPPIDLCPKCAQSTAHRLISGGTNFILKGGGWYSDLYASPKPAAKAEKTGDTTGTGAGNGTGGAAAEGAKPAAKPTSGSASAPAATSPHST